MHHAIAVPNFGDYADPHTIMRLARLAESAGWEGLFLWDHLSFVWGPPSGDPWILLTAAATVTEHMVLGTAVSPLARYRPWKLANALATLDILSHGRVILGVGLGGSPAEFAAFGEPGDRKQRASLLDEGLQVLDALWKGGPVRHAGRHYTVDAVTLSPLPIQQPRIPIWVGGNGAPSRRRASGWDGWIPDVCSETEMTMSPAVIRGKLDTVLSSRPSGDHFDVAVPGYSTPGDRSLVSEYEAAGGTWWLETLHGIRGSLDEMLARVKAGPAR